MKAPRKRAKSRRVERTAHLHRSARPSSRRQYNWIRELAAPYLKGYDAEAAREHGLQGYWFFASGVAEREAEGKNPPRSAANRKHRIGFFIGYLNEAAGKYSFLHPDPPECLVFAWIEPVGSALHERLVKQPGSLVRRIFEYIRWLTHRPPRFVFHEAEAAAMARHASMKNWPPEKREHLSRNFFIETLAWLVRSGLVRKLREEGGADAA